MKYRVLVPDFRWNGKNLKVGDEIDAENTSEILANVALGRLAVSSKTMTTAPAPVTSLAAPVPTVTSAPAAPAAPVDNPPPAPAQVMTTENATLPQRRRYARRDMTSE